MITEAVNIKYINEFVSIAGKKPVFEGIELFNDNVEDYFGDCLSMFDKKEFEEAGRALHKIKGAASSIGLVRVSDLAKKTELELLKERDSYDLTGSIDSLREVIAADISELRNFVMTLSGPSS